jgi:hypothetical protein
MKMVRKDEKWCARTNGTFRQPALSGGNDVLYLHNWETTKDSGNDIALNVQSVGASTAKSPELGSQLDQVLAVAGVGSQNKNRLKTFTGAESQRQQPHLCPTSSQPTTSIYPQPLRELFSVTLDKPKGEGRMS